MKSFKNLFTCIFSLSVMSFSALHASERDENNVEWSLALNDESAKVFTRFTAENINQEQHILFEYKVEATVNTSLSALIESINNVANHNAIFGSSRSEVIAESADRLSVYYYFDNPWPISDIDLVRTLSVTQLEAEHVVIEHRSSPSLVKLENVSRQTVSDISFLLIPISDSKVEIRMTGKFIPIGVPDFLAKSWLPEGPKDMLDKIIKFSTSL